MAEREKIMNKRESFSSRWGFICAYWFSGRYGKYLDVPTRVSLYGGGSFRYHFIFVILDRFDGVIGEMSFGRGKGRSNRCIWNCL